MRKHAAAAIVIILLHLLVATVHGVAHSKLQINLSLTQKLFVLVVITIAPLVAMVLLLLRAFAAGAALLVFSMSGALVFGVLYHFIFITSDHVMHVPRMTWSLPFQITAAMLAIIEAAGVLIGASTLFSIENAKKALAESASRFP
jgi:hypothetical protein